MMGSTRRFIVLLAAGTMLAIAAPAALAAGHGNGSPQGCTQNASRASIVNTWAWGAPGSWGMPGQQVMYAILVFNNDVGCGSSSFVITMSAPNGFSVSIPANTITLNSGSTGYLWAYVASPTTVGDGDNLLTVTIWRVGAPAADGSSTSYYKVYSADTVAPTLYWPNPWDGAVIKGRSYSVGVAASDDHSVKTIDLYIDNVYTSTSVCDDISYECQLSYKWSIRRVHGQHTATFESTDWMGNVGTLTVTFTVN